MPTRHLVDSDICIDILAGRGGARREFYQSLLAESALISVITYGEVVEGLPDSRNRERDAGIWEGILARFAILDITREVADVWAALRRDLRRRGESLPDADLLIASTALAFGLSLVTRNERHYGRVQGLRLIIPPYL